MVEDCCDVKIALMVRCSGDCKCQICCCKLLRRTIEVRSEISRKTAAGEVIILYFVHFENTCLTYRIGTAIRQSLFLKVEIALSPILINRNIDNNRCGGAVSKSCASEKIRIELRKLQSVEMLYV